MKRLLETYQQKAWQKACRLKDMLDAEAERFYGSIMNDATKHQIQCAINSVVEAFMFEEEIKGLKFKVLMHKELGSIIITDANDFTRRFMTQQLNMTDFLFKVKV